MEVSLLVCLKMIGYKKVVKVVRHHSVGYDTDHHQGLEVVPYDIAKDLCARNLETCRQSTNRENAG